ncbi:MAG: hypothetical protein V2A34_06720 [Lentisphaerota bacterium]
MKKMLVITLGLALIASSAIGQQVLSRNAVGYVRVDARSNGYTLATVPFNAFSNTIAGIFAGQLVGGSSFGTSDNVIKYLPGTGYITFWKTTAGQWRQLGEGVETTNKLYPGEAFWVVNKRVTNQVIYLMGEVPDSFAGDATQTLYAVQGYQFQAYGYPVEIAITNTTLTNGAQRGSSFGTSDNVITFDAAIQDYVTYWLSTTAGSSWRKLGTGTNTTDKFAVGQGFWYKRYPASSRTWTEVKPYTWPL